MKKFLSIVFLALIMALIGYAGFVNAQDDVSKINTTKAGEDDSMVVYYFEDKMCPVCKEQKDFLEKIKDQYPQMVLEIYPISNLEKLKEIAQMHSVENYSIMAPTTFIGDNFFQFSDFTSKHEDMIIRAIEGKIVEKECCIVRIPILNIEIDISKWSLPFMTITLASLDGLNVCSIGALILILSIVAVFNSRKKIFFYGGLFILSSVTIYGVLIFAWGKLFEILVGQIEIVRIIVGLAALGGGIYFFKEFLKYYKHGPTCQATSSNLAQKATTKVQKAFSGKNSSSWILASSIIFFAAIITLVELPCSVGIPVAFTGILAESNLSLTSYVFYILLYLFFYMFIEIVIFVGAVLTKKIWFANSKVITWITLLGAGVLFYLALYYLIGF